MTPNTYLAALLADQRATLDVERAQRSMDTKRISEAVERKKDTTHALMALQLRKTRQERVNAHDMGLAAE